MAKQVTTGDEALFTNFQFWEENVAVPTSSEAWQTVIAETALPLAAGIYRITYNFELRVVPNVTQNSGAVARVRVNSSRKADAYYHGTEWCAFSGWDRIIYATGDTPLLEIDFRRDPVEGGNDSIEIRKMKLGIEWMT